jgi:hypothetical protein
VSNTAEMRVSQFTQTKEQTFYYFPATDFLIVRLVAYGAEISSLLSINSRTATARKQFIALRSSLKETRPRIVETTLVHPNATSVGVLNLSPSAMASPCTTCRC